MFQNVLEENTPGLLNLRKLKYFTSTSNTDAHTNDSTWNSE